jgi:alpha-beta hydrolase superfamily lysophospholipase
VGIRRTEGSFDGEDGRRLFRRSWLPDAPTRVVLLVHGFAEHSGRYEAMGAWLARRGCAVHAYDHRGHGRSPGPRNYVDSFDDYLDDLGRLLDLVRKEHPTLEITIVGHSMGGLVTLAFLRERKPRVFAAVTSGPALALGEALSGTKFLLAKVLRRVAPRYLVDAGLPADGLSRDPEVARAYEADPLVDTRTTASLVLEMTTAIERTAGGGAEVEVPLLMLHGGDDPLCDAEGSRAFFASLPEPSPAKRLEVYPGLLHEIFNEPEQEQIFEDLLSWVIELESAPR